MGHDTKTPEEGFFLLLPLYPSELTPKWTRILPVPGQCLDMSTGNLEPQHSFQIPPSGLACDMQRHSGVPNEKCRLQTLPGLCLVLSKPVYQQHSDTTRGEPKHEKGENSVTEVKSSRSLSSQSMHRSCGPEGAKVAFQDGS